MAGINDIVVRGYGSWGSVNDLPTLGYGIREASEAFGGQFCLTESRGHYRIEGRAHISVGEDSDYEVNG